MRLRLPLAVAAVAALAAVVAGSAFAHAELSPPVALAKAGQLFTLAVPTEKEDATHDEDRADRPRRLLDRLVRAGRRAGSARSSRPARARTR